MNSFNEPLPKRFIYFALHFRPERSTIPEANTFYDQASCISLLSQAIPEDFHIIVKEHPRQVGDTFVPDLRRVHFPELQLYNRIKLIPKVRFAPTELLASDLIEKSSLVASCTGSALWEALQLGKPALSFGSSWHSSCRSSPNVASFEDLNVAIRSLLNKSAIDVRNDLDDFLSYIYPYTLAVAYSHESAMGSDIPYEVHVARLVSAIEGV
jgi:CDP-glycerol glycerophosphotransferase (TagB/SpsB family)